MCWLADLLLIRLGGFYAHIQLRATSLVLTGYGCMQAAIEIGDGLPDIRTTKQCLAALHEAGFEVQRWLSSLLNDSFNPQCCVIHDEMVLSLGSSGRRLGTDWPASMVLTTGSYPFLAHWISADVDWALHHTLCSTSLQTLHLQYLQSCKFWTPS